MAIERVIVDGGIPQYTQYLVSSYLPLGSCPKLRQFMVPALWPAQFLWLDFSHSSRSQPVGLVPPTWLPRISDP